MKSIIETNRLFLRLLTTNDYKFIKNLLNTEGWIQFIGDRNIKTDEDAIAYIKKVIDNTKVKYWVVELKNNNTPIGIITFIKRDYLEYNDLGFAFLPDFGNNGFAFEASNAILEELKSDKKHQHILATTIPENSKSIILLEKNGFIFREKIENNLETLAVYIKTF